MNMRDLRSDAITEQTNFASIASKKAVDAAVDKNKKFGSVADVNDALASASAAIDALRGVYNDAMRLDSKFVGDAKRSLGSDIKALEKALDAIKAVKKY